MKTSRFKSKTTWREKLERDCSKLVPIPPAMQKRFGAGTILIPRPLDVDALIRSIPRGQLITQTHIRTLLAKRYGADVTCPLTTGIFVRIAAEAAEEDRRAGTQQITPYWRVVRDDGTLLEKLPGGAAAQARRLAEEGHTITKTGTKMRVQIDRAPRK